MIYKVQNKNEVNTIILRSHIFSIEGRKIITPSMFLTYKQKYNLLDIADIRIEEKDSNKGYGSAFMKAMFMVVNEFPQSIKYITGWISSVDWHHIDRNKHFYEKHGFKVEIDESIKQGNIVWVNPLSDGSFELYNNLNYSPGIFGILDEINDL